MTSAERFFNRLFNRFGIIPIVVGFLFITAVIARAIFFWDQGIRFQVFSLIVNVVSIGFFWIGFTRIHRWFNCRMPYDQGVIRRFALEYLAGLVLGTVGWWGVAMLIKASGFLPFVMTVQIQVLTFMMVTLLTGLINAGFLVQHYFERWKQTLIQSERLKRQVAAVQLENLINQVNPHFLFNSLTSLSSLIGDEPELARRFVAQLAKVYRYVLQNREQALVSLETEVSFIRSYTFLLETRYQQGIHITFAPGLEHEKRKIVPVTLQVLIENAIKHNIIAPSTPLYLHIFLENDHVVIQNTLQRKSTVPESNKSGLANLCKLYAFLSDQSIVITETEEAFIVKIPLL